MKKNTDPKKIGRPAGAAKVTLNTSILPATYAALEAKPSKPSGPVRGSLSGRCSTGITLNPNEIPPPMSNPTTRYRCTYAFDVPYYADFHLPAGSQEEAERIAARLLESGQLAEILDGHAEKCWDNACNERVFSSDEATVMEIYERLEDIAKSSKVKLPGDWATPPPAEPAAIGLMRGVLVAQLALWDALKALEKHAQLDIPSMEATKWAVDYKDARAVESAPADEIARIYASIISGVR